MLPEEGAGPCGICCGGGDIGHAKAGPDVPGRVAAKRLQQGKKGQGGIVMAGRPYIYNGQGFSLLRDKNRFVLPNAFRPTVRESSGKDLLCLTTHDRWPCLVGFGLSRIDEFADELKEEQELAIRAGKEFDADKRASDIYASYEVPFDGSGRFVLPEDLTALAGVTDQLYFRGNGRFFTVWSPESLYEMDDSWKAAQTACKSLAAKDLAKVGRK